MFTKCKSLHFEILTRKLVLPGIAVLFLFSCKKTVTVPPPTDFVVSEVIFQNDATAIGAVTGIYSEMMSNRNSTQQFSSSGITIYTGMSADELSHTQLNLNSRAEFINNQLNGSIAFLSTLFWDRSYKYIYTANACLDGLEKSTGVTPSIKDKLKGECYFIRAFCYFQLVNLFGGVPLALTSDYRKTMTLPRESVDKIYDQMIKDLQDAKTLLPEEYDLTGGNPERTRPNKWTATALLARVYLYKKDWINAEIQSSAVIGSGMYSLKTSPGAVFSASSSEEAIWQLLPVVATNNTWEGSLLLPPTGSTSLPGYFLTSSLANAFEPGDRRFTNWVGSRLTYNFVNKYKIKTTSPTAKEYYVVFRLAEQYLIRAEARAHLDRSDAIDDVDEIRERAGLNGTTTTTKEELLSAIEQERRVELFAEWGHRWFDLKRTNRADAVLGALKPTWQSTDALWPIPSEQIRLNGALVQNPGY